MMTLLTRARAALLRHRAPDPLVAIYDTQPLPPARDELTDPGYRMDLDAAWARYHQSRRPPSHRGDGEATGSPAYIGRHRAILHDDPGPITQEFARIVGGSYTSAEMDTLMAAEWRCESCDPGRDGEHQHRSCHGCSCPCTTMSGAQVVHIGQREVA